MVELLIVIAIIGILTTIGFMSFGKYQSDVRDSERSNKASIISEYLETYYEQNGEYPSCPGLITDPNTVKATTLPGIDTNVLTAPQRPSGELNSIKCTDLTSMSQADYFAYVGDGSAACTTGTSCLEYTIKYKDESANSIASVTSRHQTDIVTSGNIGNLNASATGFTSINLTWESIDNATSYIVQRALDINFSTNLVSSSATGLSSSITGLNLDTRYFFRVQPTASNSTGNWSNTANTYTWGLAAPVGTATTNSNTQITESWGAVSHAASYNVQIDVNSAFSTPTSYNTTSLSRAFTGLIPGKIYSFRVQAVNGSYTSSWSATDNATTTISAPVCSATTNSTTQITEACAAISGAVSYNYQVDNNTGFTAPSTYNSTAISRAMTGLTPGQTWYFRVQAVGANTSSGWSATNSATTTISAPVCSATTNSTTQITVACGAISGATAYNYQVDDNSLFSSSAQYSSASASYAVTGLTPGKTWYFRVQTVGANASSGWSGTSNATTTISAPSVSATANSLTQITASWAAISGAVSYTVQMDSTSAFSAPTSYSTTSLSQAFTGLLPATTYYFRVQTIGVNTSSSWSGTATRATNSPTLSGAITCTGIYNVRTQFTIYLRLNETAYNISANSSTVAWTAYRYVNTTWSGTFNQNTGHSHNVVVNGTSVKSGASRTYRFLNASAIGSYELLYGTSSANVNTYDSGSINVAHNADGSKAISASISDNFTGGQVPGVASCSIASYTLSDLR